MCVRACMSLSLCACECATTADTDVFTYLRNISQNLDENVRWFPTI